MMGFLCLWIGSPASRKSKIVISIMICLVLMLGSFAASARVVIFCRIMNVWRVLFKIVKYMIVLDFARSA